MEYPQILDTSKLSDKVAKMEKFLLDSIIGQERAVREFVKAYQQMSVGMNRSDRPAITLLFTGPTGVGKTELCRCVAQFLLGKKDAITRIDCSEYSASHDVAKLIGSPPGYVGYSDRGSARLAQEEIDKYQTAECKINILLFDEIEEAHDSLLSALLQILDAGRLTLGNGKETNFNRTIVVITSNLGEKETQRQLSGMTLGFQTEAEEEEEGSKDQKIYQTSKKAVTKYFKAKLMNRIDRLVVFRSLSDDSLRKILRLELDKVERRLWEAPSKVWELYGAAHLVSQFRPKFKVTEAAQAFLLKKGTSRVYGARELNRVIDRLVVFPLSALVGSKQIEHGDMLEIDYTEGGKELVFRKTGKRDIAPLIETPPPGVDLSDPAKLDEFLSKSIPSLPPRKPLNLSERSWYEEYERWKKMWTMER